MLLLLALSSSVALAAEPSVEEGVGQALSLREDPGCQHIFAIGSQAEVRAALTSAVETSLPPWAPLRAAGCLTELAATDDAAWQTVQGLLQRPDQPGFVLAVVERVDVLPEARAERAAQLAMERVQTARALRRTVPTKLSQSTYPQVRAVVPTVAAE